jgi:DNA-binding transcriptional MocR family regulator
MGFEMITIPMTNDGPDMDMVEKLVAEDETIKGIWCVPLYSNPQGICYSAETIERLCSMKTAAKDFRIMWDNAYGVHDIYEKIRLKDVFVTAKMYHNEDRIMYYFSTSKITFPGAGVALMAASEKNLEEVKSQMKIQTIGYDKLNQLRHVKYFKSADGIRQHMANLAASLRPKFDVVLSTLEREIGDSGFATWLAPKGGYFVSVDTLPGCAKETVALAKEAGVILTDAGATYPYGKDPNDTNIRIAPSYPTVEELQQAMDLFCLCIKLAGVNQLLEL